MKTILIDTRNKAVTEIEIDGGLKSIYDALDVRMIETATYLPNGDAVYVDEEGMMGLDKDSGFFDIGAHQPFAGNGLVIGTNHTTGDSVGCKSTVEEIRKQVKFRSLFEVIGLG